MMFDLVRELYPILRSITGDGVRRTLAVVSRELPAPLALREVPSGAQVLDWTVPDEWNLREAYVADARGHRVIDVARSSLHIVSYSRPIRARMPLAELRPHLHTLPDRPDWIPYRTSYYAPEWGFCLAQRQLDALPEGEYEVVIDATLAPGHLTYGELVLPGARADEEVLFSTHVCHPSLANDNLSAIAVAVALARELAGRPRRHTYRFLFAPGTIGAIAWLAASRDSARRIRHGLTLVCLGDSAPFTYKRTFAGDAGIDRAAVKALADSGQPHQTIDFFPYGYDERQFNSPGFRLPVGSLMRGRHGQFPEYHTSADRPELLVPARLEDSLSAVLALFERIEGNARYRNLAPYGEPQLGKRGIYRAMGGERNLADLSLAMLWLLSLSDGRVDLLAAAERSKLPFALLRQAADVLEAHGLLAIA